MYGSRLSASPRWEKPHNKNHLNYLKNCVRDTSPRKDQDLNLKTRNPSPLFVLFYHTKRIPVSDQWITAGSHATHTYSLTSSANEPGVKWEMKMTLGDLDDFAPHKYTKH